MLLLYRAGYNIGRFIPLEKIVEDSKESYYVALALSSRGWHEAEHDLEPWTQYFLGTLIAAYRDFEARIETSPSPRGAKTEMVLAAFDRLPTTFRIADLEQACPIVTRDMIRVVLGQLKAEGRVVAIGRGPGARWKKL